MQSGAVGGHQKLLWKCTQLMQPVSFKRLQGWGEYYQKQKNVQERGHHICCLAEMDSSTAIYASLSCLTGLKSDQSS